MGSTAIASQSRVGSFDPDNPGVGLCLSYGFGTIAIAVLLHTVTTFFPALMTTVLGQSPALAGLLLTLSKLYDIVVDLFVGNRIDRTDARMKKRRRTMLAGSILGAVSFFLLFSPPDIDGPWLIIFLSAILLLYSTGYSLFAVPYVAMGPDIARSYDGRTRLMAFRTFFSALGQMGALAGAAWLVEMGNGGIAGYRLMGAVLALVILASQLSAWIGTGVVPEPEPHPPSERIGFVATFRQLLRNRPAVMLLSAKLLQYISLAVNISSGLLFKLNVLQIGYEGQAQLSVAQNIAMGVCTPLWMMAGKRFGKKNCYLASIGLYGLVMLSWLLEDSSITTFGLLSRGVLQGVGAGGMILMSLAMLPDVMQHDMKVNGVRRDGIYSSVYAVFEKTGFALGAALIGTYLSFAGYQSTTGGKLIQQSDAAIDALYFGNAVAPALLLGLSFVIMLFYPLGKASVDKQETPV
jgi:GPH family glycoside/pentoside/hexuronide:cation symporter